MALGKQTFLGMGVDAKDKRGAPEGLIAAIIFIFVVFIGRLIRLNPKVSIAIALISVPVTVGVWFFDVAGASGIGLIYLFAAFPILIGLLPFATGFFAIFGIGGMLFFDHHLLGVTFATALIAVVEIFRSNEGSFTRWAHAAVASALMISPVLYLDFPITETITAQAYCDLTPASRCETFKKVLVHERERIADVQVPRMLQTHINQLHACADDATGQKCLDLFVAVDRDCPQCGGAFTLEACKIGGSMWACIKTLEIGNAGQAYQAAGRLWDYCDTNHKVACDSVTAHYNQVLVNDKTPSAHKEALKAAQRGCSFGATISCQSLASLKSSGNFVSQ